MQVIESNELEGIRWPGPRPYDEHEWRDFFGRGPEIEDIVQRVRVEKLTVLLGGSGSGKTSLIRAGVVALLRNDRYLGGDKTSWPVLLLRRWAARGDSNLENNLLDQLEAAIEAIGNWGQAEAKMDADFLRAVVKRGGHGERKGLVQVVETLAREQARRKDGDVTDPKASQASGIILVFDQFEELLRSSRRATAEILRMIGDLAESKAPTRILLSMRQEYRYALRDLEVLLGGLGNRSIYLRQLDAPSVVQVIEQVSGSGELGVDGNVARAIVGWLSIGQRKVLREKESLELGTGDEPPATEDVVRPDLLRLQAVLVDLCRFARGAGAKRITGKVLQRFVSVRSEERRRSWASIEPPRSEVEDEGDRELTDEGLEDARIREVLDGALERWIESAIASKVSGEVSPGEEASKLASGDLGLQVRRIAVRLAPLLSSADYKVAQEENVLFRQSLGDDIGKLLFRNPRLVSALTIVEASSVEKLHLDWSAIGGVADLPMEGRQSVLSGRSRIDGWTLEETGDRILRCFRETLERLLRANILQRTTLGDQEGKVYWELVHDQLGPHFTQWAVNQKGTWDDCRSSLVVSRGVQPIAIQEELICPGSGEDFYDLESVSWQGCGVSHASSRRVELRNVRFRSCFLVGTIFDSIDFVGCLFEKCNLKGGLFRSCGFRATRFEQCDANIAILGGVIDDLEFRNCHMSQSVIDGTELKGEIHYTEGSRVIQGYLDVLRAPDAVDVRIVFDAGSRAHLCLWGSSSAGVLKFMNQDLDRRNSGMDVEFRVRP